LQNPKVRFKKGVVFISGTNGKTTTSKILVHFLETAGFKVTHNQTGANLLNGIASTILLDMDWFGNLGSDYGVFEVDEFSLPIVLTHLEPSVVVLLNLSRDQLDRYGEVDTIFDRWKRSLSPSPNLDDINVVAEAFQKNFSGTVLVLDEDLPVFKGLIENYAGTVLYFDSAITPNASFFEKFNAKNINAALVVGEKLGLQKEVMFTALTDFKAAFGRGELIDYEGKSIRILLAKNPASFNFNVDFVSYDDLAADTLLFILNDNIPDGRDVSWIYDIDPTQLYQACQGKQIFVAGTRYLDMAIRLDYAGVPVPEENLFSDLGIALNSITANQNSKDVLILPNYSAMLEVRKLLVGRSIL